jgi:hypothetical protein
MSFGTKLRHALVGPSETEIRAAGTVPLTPTGKGAGSVGWSPTQHLGTAWGRDMRTLADISIAAPWDELWCREAAMSLPTIARARDLLVSAVSSLPFGLWKLTWDSATESTVERQIPPAGWMGRPDPSKTRQHILAWTADDLIFWQRAYWRVNARYADTYPAAFERMPAAEVTVDLGGQVRWNGGKVEAADVVEFLSPNDSLLTIGWRAITTALELDDAARRFAGTDVPAGWLQQVSGEPMSGAELADLASDFEAARRLRTTAALNTDVNYHEGTSDPTRLQLVEARQHQAVELARLMDTPAYLVNAPAGTGMTYLNAQQAKADLIDFGALPIIGCIEQTLGGPNVVPNGQAVRLDLNVYLRSPLTTGQVSPNDLQIAYGDGAGQLQNPPAPSAPGAPTQALGGPP